MPSAEEAELVFAWLEGSGGAVAVCHQPGLIGVLDAADAGAYLPLVRFAQAQDMVVAATADIRVTARGLCPRPSASSRTVPDRAAPRPDAGASMAGKCLPRAAALGVKETADHFQARPEQGPARLDPGEEVRQRQGSCSRPHRGCRAMSFHMALELGRHHPMEAVIRTASGPPRAFGSRVS